MKLISSNEGTNDYVSEFQKSLNERKPIFVLFYMDGCNPCNLMKPEWMKLKNILSEKDIVIADIERNHLNQLKLPVEINSFPTIYFIKNSKYELYDGERSVDAFFKWIQNKSVIGGKKRKTKKRKKRGMKFRKNTIRIKRHK